MIQIPFWNGLGLRLLREWSVTLQIKFEVVVIGDPGLRECSRSRGVGMGGGLVGAGLSPEPRCPLPALTRAQAPFCQDRLGDTLTIQPADKRGLLVGLNTALEAHTPAIGLGSPLARAVTTLFCPSPHSGPQGALGGWVLPRPWLSKPDRKGSRVLAPARAGPGPGPLLGPLPGDTRGAGSAVWAAGRELRRQSCCPCCMQFCTFHSCIGAAHASLSGRELPRTPGHHTEPLAARCPAPRVHPGAGSCPGRPTYLAMLTSLSITGGVHGALLPEHMLVQQQRSG